MSFWVSPSHFASIANLISFSAAVHTSGSAQTYTGSELHNDDWYTATFLPKMENYKKGPLVWSNGKLKTEAESNSRLNAIVDGKVYDLTDYFYTVGHSLRASLRLETDSRPLTDQPA